MKKFYFVSILSLLLSSCGNLTSAMQGGTENNLKDYVEMTENCPKENIIIKDKEKAGGVFTYVVDVCGEEKMYQQVGGSVQEVK